VTWIRGAVFTAISSVIHMLVDSNDRADALAAAIANQQGRERVAAGRREQEEVEPHVGKSRRP
jgi:hypothetical protein